MVKKGTPTQTAESSPLQSPKNTLGSERPKSSQRITGCCAQSIDHRTHNIVHRPNTCGGVPRYAHQSRGSAYCRDHMPVFEQGTSSFVVCCVLYVLGCLAEDHGVLRTEHRS